MTEYKEYHLKIPVEDFETIKLNAAASDKTVTAYAKEVMVNRAVINIDYESIREHTKEISELKKDLNMVLHTIMKTEEVYNPDIQNILEILNDILKSERKFLDQMEKDREKKKREIKKELRKISEKQINPKSKDTPTR